MPTHWTDLYFGQLYYESVADLLSEPLSRLEALAIRRLLGLGPADRVLDLGCGHGRHLGAVRPGVRALVGLDRSAPYLDVARRRGDGLLVRGDLRALPVREGSFDAAYSWYASLFMFDDAENERVLAAAGRCVRPGGRLLVHHANPLRLAGDPTALAERDLPGGGRVEEVSRFDAATGVDACTRTLRRPGGELLAATARLRYYTPDEWRTLAARASLRLARLTCRWHVEGPDLLDAESPDLVAVLERPQR